MDEEQASWCVISISGCLRDKHWGAPVRWRCETLPLPDLWCVCVCGEWVGGVRERERGGRQEGCGGAAAWDKRERETRELPWRSSG